MLEEEEEVEEEEEEEREEDEGIPKAMAGRRRGTIRSYHRDGCIGNLHPCLCGLLAKAMLESVRCHASRSPSPDALVRSGNASFK